MPIMDLDGDGTPSANSDGLMLVKYMIGQRGNTLTNSGALIGVGATRTTPIEIQSYIEYIYPRLDVDGDGNVAFSDALMIFLYMIGLRDDNLILSGGNNTFLIEPGARRTTADEIEAYIETLVT